MVSENRKLVVFEVLNVGHLIACRLAKRVVLSYFGHKGVI